MDLHKTRRCCLTYPAVWYLQFTGYIGILHNKMHSDNWSFSVVNIHCVGFTKSADSLIKGFLITLDFQKLPFTSNNNSDEKWSHRHAQLMFLQCSWASYRYNLHSFTMHLKSGWRLAWQRKLTEVMLCWYTKIFIILFSF